MVKYFAQTMLYVVLTLVGAFGFYILCLAWPVLDTMDKAFIFSISSILISFYMVIGVFHRRTKRHENHLPHDEAGH
ncbi:hypothetical protein D3C76_28210 [compost metagenome]